MTARNGKRILVAERLFFCIVLVALPGVVAIASGYVSVHFFVRYSETPQPVDLLVAVVAAASFFAFTGLIVLSSIREQRKMAWYRSIGEDSDTPVDH